MPRVLIAASSRGNGITRAVETAQGGWQVKTGLHEYDVRCLAADPLNARVLYAGTQHQGVLKSDDLGRSWQPTSFQTKTVKSIAASPLKEGVVLAGTRPAEIHISTDAGESWRELKAFRKIRSRPLWFSPAEPPFSAYVQSIALSPNDPQRIIAGVEAGAVVMSTDGGHTWSDHRRGSLRDCHTLIFHQNDGEWAYEAGGTGGGAAYTRDGGQTWNKVGKSLDRNYAWAVAADPAKPGIWYVSASPGPSKAHSGGNAQAAIFRSMHGAPWEKLAGGLPEVLDHMPYALTVDADKPGHLYAGLSNGNIWHSEDHGDHWRELPLAMDGIWGALLLLKEDPA